MGRRCGNCIHKNVCDLYDIAQDPTNAVGCGNFLDTADVVEVVRCKDCAHRVALPKQYDYNGHFAMVCLMRSKSVKHNGYCDEGIRKAKKGGAE